MNRIRVLVVVLLLLAVPFVAHAEDKVLPETFVSEDGMLSLHYPSGWYANTVEDGQVLVSTSRVSFQLDMEDVPSGEAGVYVTYTMGSHALDSRVLQGSDPLLILNNLVDSIGGWSDYGLDFDEPESVTFADHPAARVYGWSGNNELFILLVNNGLDQFSLIVGYAPEGELNKVEPKLLAIAESTTYQTPSNL